MSSTAQEVEEFLIPLSADSSLRSNPSAVTSNQPSINDEQRGGDNKGDVKETFPTQSVPSSDTSIVESSMSPTPNSSLAPFSDSRPPESPDMKFARTRLGHLLSGIRTGEIQTNAQPARGARRDVDDDETSPSHLRMKRALRRERRVVFELRGKPFGLRDSGHNEAIFSLCRTWMRGKEEELPKDEEPPIQYPQPTDDTLDLLATKDIMALPAPIDEPMVDPIPPPISQIPSPDLDVSNPNALLNDLLPHWKAVKKNWCDYTKVRDKRYEKSIRLLETVYGIQQNVL